MPYTNIVIFMHLPKKINKSRKEKRKEKKRKGKNF